jgi:hypothetical protein
MQNFVGFTNKKFLDFSNNPLHLEDGLVQYLRLRVWVSSRPKARMVFQIGNCTDMTPDRPFVEQHRVTVIGKGKVIR